MWCESNVYNMHSTSLYITNSEWLNKNLDRNLHTFPPRRTGLSETFLTDEERDQAKGLLGLLPNTLRLNFSSQTKATWMLMIVTNLQLVDVDPCKQHFSVHSITSIQGVVCVWYGPAQRTPATTKVYTLLVRCPYLSHLYVLLRKESSGVLRRHPTLKERSNRLCVQRLPTVTEAFCCRSESWTYQVA